MRPVLLSAIACVAACGGRTAIDEADSCAHDPVVTLLDAAPRYSLHRTFWAENGLTVLYALADPGPLGGLVWIRQSDDGAPIDVTSALPEEVRHAGILDAVRLGDDIALLYVIDDGSELRYQRIGMSGVAVADSVSLPVDPRFAREGWLTPTPTGALVALATLPRPDEPVRYYILQIDHHGVAQGEPLVLRNPECDMPGTAYLGPSWIGDVAFIVCQRFGLRLGRTTVTQETEVSFNDDVALSSPADVPWLVPVVPAVTPFPGGGALLRVLTWDSPTTSPIARWGVVPLSRSGDPGAVAMIAPPTTLASSLTLGEGPSSIGVALGTSVSRGAERTLQLAFSELSADGSPSFAWRTIVSRESGLPSPEFSREGDDSLLWADDSWMYVFVAAGSEPDTLAVRAIRICAP